MLAIVALASAQVVSADGGCQGQYGQAVECPTPKKEEFVHKPVEAGLADLINPFTVGAAFTGASAVMYHKARKSTLV